MTTSPFPWREISKAELERALDDLFDRLRGEGSPASRSQAEPITPTEVADHLPIENSPTLPEDVPNALDQLTVRFGLSPFERDLLLAAVGHELDARFPELLGGPPTFAGLSPRLPEAHWSALAPDGPLRRGRLLTLDPATEALGLVRRPWRVEEAVLHELLGLPQLDDALRPYLLPLAPSAADRLANKAQATAQALVDLWTSPERALAWLSRGNDPADARAVVVAAARALGWSVLVLDGGRLPHDPHLVEDLVERWQRDAVLQDFVLVIEPSETEGLAGYRPVRQWLERAAVGTTVWIAAEAPPVTDRPVIRLDLPAADPAETSAMWRQALGPVASSLNGAVDRLAQQFDLTPRAVQEVAAEVRLVVAGSQSVEHPDRPALDPTPLEPAELEKVLWRKARHRARGGLDHLAQRLEPVAEWPDLILPEPQMQVLRSVVTHVRRRHRVYQTWGFAEKSRRGLGISALFSGPSGTGKTLAAEVLARELDLDLYRIDLSAVVSKYIGETESNLSRLFDAAERSGAILLFDEADSLFGKRSEVRDSHDRYANLEVSYLLQRVEAYRGLAILTTNFEKSLDTAFARRLRFVVPFPMPSQADRRRIWQRVLPDATPTADLNWDRLAQLTVTGGLIRNIALGAAFRAADEDRAVTMVDMAAAARAEVAKSGRQVPSQELRGWTG